MSVARFTFFKGTDSEKLVINNTTYCVLRTILCTRSFTKYILHRLLYFITHTRVGTNGRERELPIQTFDDVTTLHNTTLLHPWLRHGSVTQVLTSSVLDFPSGERKRVLEAREAKLIPKMPRSSSILPALPLASEDGLVSSGERERGTDIRNGRIDQEKVWGEYVRRRGRMREREWMLVGSALKNEVCWSCGRDPIWTLRLFFFFLTAKPRKQQDD